MTPPSDGAPRHHVRRPAVAGLFYPADPDGLAAALDEAMAGAVVPEPGAPVPRALIAPHAGYRYSGPVAASAHLRLAPGRGRITRVVLVGPSHHVPVTGLATSSAEAFATPFGPVPVDEPARTTVLSHPTVTIDDAAHAPEHSLEVHLPFLQRILGDFTLVPLVAGRADPASVADVLGEYWDDPHTVTVVSTDLSHYLTQPEAELSDARTAAAIVACSPAEIGHLDACGHVPLEGLLTLASSRGAQVTRLDLRTSGDTSGDRSRVVGYGAFAVT